MSSEFEPSNGTPPQEEGFGDAKQPRRPRPVSTPPDLTAVPEPQQQLVRTAHFLGFDPASCVATFAVETEGRREELAVWVQREDPMFNGHYKLLLAAQNGTGQKSFRIRVAMPTVNDGRTPATLLLATPTIEKVERDFNLKEARAHWTQSLDKAVTVDFEQSADAFASQHIAKLLHASDKDPMFGDVSAWAREIFRAEAGAVGLTGGLDSMFDEHARLSLTEIASGREQAGGTERQVRYDPRFSFRDQAGAAHTSPAEVASALVNYAFQKAVSVDAAAKAQNGVTLANGALGSLARAHQEKLVADNVLLAPNPHLADYEHCFAQYSHEATRTAAAHYLAGMMDAAGVPAAVPERDAIEHEKRDDLSKHRVVLQSVPEDSRNSADPLVRAGAFIGTAAQLDDVWRGLSKSVVAAEQSRAAPTHNEMPPRAETPNAAADAIRAVISGVEKAVDLM